MKSFYFLKIMTYSSLEMLLEMSLGICKNRILAVYDNYLLTHLRVQIFKRGDSLNRQNINTCFQ